MTTAMACKWMGIRLTTKQRLACRYLERVGQRFCVEFGYGNAVEKAREHWRARRTKMRGA